MRWEWRSECSARAGMFWRRSSKVGQSLKLGSRPSQAFPRGAAAADDDGRRLADCVGYVCTYPNSQMEWTSSPNILQQFLLPAATWDQAATDTDARQDLDSFRFRYMLPKCNGTITIQQVIDVGQGHKQIISCASLHHIERCRQYCQRPPIATERAITHLI